MVKILLTNLGNLANPGIAMMVMALVENIEAKFFVHRLTICQGYEPYGIKYSWKYYGYDMALDMGGDTFSTYYGLPQFLRHAFHLFMLWLFNQRYAIFSQTLCNYGTITSRLAGFFLKRAVFITVRGTRSFIVAKRYNHNSVEVADVAWLVNGMRSNDYHGSSYHRLILAAISEKKFEWNGEGRGIFKFDIFKKPIKVEEMKLNARKNFEVLQRFLVN